MENRSNKPQFVPGLELAEGFYRDEVEPVIRVNFSDLKYSAALIGSGSEVLGFDSEMSTDHHWGPRVMLFLLPDDYESRREFIRSVLSKELPVKYKGYPTNFSEPDPEDNGVQTMQPIKTGPVNHRVEIFTIQGFFYQYLNIDIEKSLDTIDWLTLPQQKLRSIIAGRVFRDDIGLQEVRERFSWYPHDVWLYILASAWKRLGQEEHLMGRAGLAGDEIGSAIIGSRLARDIMRLVFLMEKEYQPYAKWFGTAFSKLKYAGKLEQPITGVIHACSWQEREEHLCVACQVLTEIYNIMEITEPITARVTHFWDRPFRIIQAEKIAAAIVGKIRDPQVIPIARRVLIGNVDLFSDNTDLLENLSLRPVLRHVYE
jgi:hypothetical protein